MQQRGQIMKMGRLWVALTFSLLVMMFSAGNGMAQFAGGGPKPGDVYKEFYFTNDKTNWRVTDPGMNTTKFPEGLKYLPNPVMNISIDDFSGASRAEVVIDFWGGHDGTTGKKFRFNKNAWIPIPELSALSSSNPSPGNMYMQQVNHLIPIPLSHLKAGVNSFEGTSGPNGWGWGQWGWYGIVLRVYYSSSKPHAEGVISSPTSNSLFSDNPTVTASITSGTANRVDFLAYYDGFDRDGDGVYKDWQRYYHRNSWTESTGIKGHVGTATASPFRVTWDTTWVPDQDPGQVKLVARIRNTNGYWYVTPIVQNLSFQRSRSSVRLYKPFGVPQKYWVRVDQLKTSKVNIPSLSGATGALMQVNTWNGKENNAVFYNKVNSWTAPKYGNDHFFSHDQISVPVSALKTGDNIITYSSSTVHHGIEILWPGPAIAVRYGSAPPTSAPAITQHPTDQTVSVGQTATFSVSATGTLPLSYQWRKNGVNISGATSASYTTPAATTSDNGALFSCVVSNSYGKATSNNARLTVQSSPPGTAPTITQQPASQYKQVGETATFSVAASGSTPMSYQWRKNGSSISGATSASYTTPAISSSDNGATFSCVVSNSYGSVTSSGAVLTVGSAPPPSVSNLVSNPGFESGTTSWTYYNSGKGSFTASTPGASGSRAGRIAVTTAGTNHQLYQQGISLEPNTDYQLSFAAYSNSGRDLSVSIQKHGSPYTNYGLSRQKADLGTNWSVHTISFKTRNFSTSVSDARLMFWLADTAVAGDEFWIDDVVLNKGGSFTPPPAAVNVLGNPGFEAGTTQWTFYTNGSGSFSIVTPGHNSTNAGRAAINSPGTNVQLYQSGLSLEHNTDYQLSFAAYSNTGKGLSVSLMKHGSPFTNYGISKQAFNLGTGWAVYTLSFRTKNFSTAVNDGRLMFWFADTAAAGDQFFIDNVVLSKK